MLLLYFLYSSASDKTKQKVFKQNLQFHLSKQKFKYLHKKRNTTKSNLFTLKY